MVRAIHTEARGQLVFMDTPGVHKATHDLGRIMNRTARAAIAGADVALLVLDPSAPLRDEDEGWMRKLAKAELNLVFVLNKRDLDWPYEQDYREAWERCRGDAVALWMPLSAMNGVGVDDLMGVLFDAVPEGPALFPEEMLTDFPRKLSIGDVIREKYFKVLRDELPHDLAVRVGEIVEKGERCNFNCDHNMLWSIRDNTTGQAQVERDLPPSFTTVDTPGTLCP
jgi:GTP-binding protein Era